MTESTTRRCEEVLQEKLDELSEVRRLLSILVLRRGGVLRIDTKEARLFHDCLISEQADGSIVIRVLRASLDVTEDV